ncbi:MAG: MGMT family protein [Desulfurococcales archaeon]|nr:MGMT family protein [Desulfurococcales archaeon]
MPLLVLREDGSLSRARLQDYMDALKALLLIVPAGNVTTYRSLARLLGVSPRLVGALLSMNDEPLIVPCHRVVRSDGDIGGYSLGGRRFKRKILETEGVYIEGDRVDRCSLVDLGEELIDG